MTPLNSDSKSVPIRCLIEVVNHDQPTCNGRIVEKESFAIVPSNSLFRDVVKTVLMKLGYTAQEVSNATGAIQIKNWRALDLEQVTDNALASVEDMLGDLTTVATLRIKITSGSLSDDVKDKLLLMLLGQSYDILQKKGCPIPKDELERVVAGKSEFSSSTQSAFYSWYSKVPPTSVNSHEVSGNPSHPSQPAILTPSRATRLRISFDSDEVSRLQKWFEQDPHPSRHQMTTYLNELNSLPPRMALKPLDLTNIMYWFKNARAAARRNGRSITSEDLSDDDERQSDREGSTTSAPPLPNSNAVYMIKDPLVDNAQNKDTNSTKASEDSEMEEDLSVTDEDDDEDEDNRHTSQTEKSDNTDVRVKQEEDGNDGITKANPVSSSSSSPNIPPSFMSMASRLPGYPFPYGPLPMAYLQTQMNPFYKDWSEKVQSVVAQAQANNNQPNLNMVKPKVECELSKAERQKRHRAFIDPVSEIPKLEQWFTKDTHPSHYVIEQICDDLNRGEFRSRYPKLSPKNIQLWFKNHRAKVKRMRVGGGNLNLNFGGINSPQSPPPSGLALSMME